MNKRLDKIMAEARKLARTAESWADFSNALFDPEQGLLPGLHPSESARARFIRSKEYQEIMDLMSQVQRRTGLVAGATPTKSGKFIVRLPRSLHEALVTEAKEEGISLNQLVLTKLAVQLSRAVRKKTG